MVPKNEIPFNVVRSPIDVDSLFETIKDLSPQLTYIIEK